jgi:hypothetical protein
MRAFADLLSRHGQSYFPRGVAAKPLRAGQGMSTSVTRETVVRRAT